MTAGKTAPLFNTVNTEDLDPMDVAHEAKEQELCDALTQRDAEIRIAMAKLGRWGSIFDSRKYGGGLNGYPPHYRGDLNDQTKRELIPDFLKDLNAVHEVEKLVPAGVIKGGAYERALCRTTNNPYCATARQRCENRLKITGNWNTKWNDQ